MRLPWLRLLPVITVFTLFLDACAQPATVPESLTTSSTLSGIVVYPPTGQPEPLSMLLAKSLSNALIRRGYKASVAQTDNQPVDAEFSISGRSETLEAIHAPTVAALYWTLKDSDGREVAYLTQGVRGKAEDWAYGSPAMLHVVGDQAATDLTPFLGHSPLAEEQIVPIYQIAEELAHSDDLVPLVSQQSQAEPAPAPQPAPPVAGENRGVLDMNVWVDDVTGAPGDGNQALTRALLLELNNASVPFAISASAASHFVQGVVDISVVDAVTEHVEILWIVSNSDGEEIGRITQGNDIARGTLHQSWGDTARYAAIGGAQAVISILERDYGNN